MIVKQLVSSVEKGSGGHQGQVWIYLEQVMSN